MHDVAHLFGMLPEDLATHLRSHGVTVRDAEARRVIAHVVASAAEGFPRSRPVPRSLEQAVTKLTRRDPLPLIDRVTDESDGFVKYLFRLADGLAVEAVRIPLEQPGRFTICLSTQAGCAMRCSFCATGRLGLSRNLASWEIVAQFLAVRADTPGTVTGAVFQGEGEPLQNFDEVVHAAKILSHPCGGRISAKAITISTVGLVPAIHRFAEERHPFRLIVSLTSAVNARRRTLVPVAARWSVEELADAVRAYQRTAGTRATLAWVLLGGINHDEAEVEALSRNFGDVPIRLNLIDVNDARPDGFRRATPEELAEFRDRLRTLGIPVVRRYSGGREKHAACGMLAGAANARPIA